MQLFSGSADEWNRLIAGLPSAHLLQSWEWAQVKGQVGWMVLPFIWKSGTYPSDIAAAAMVLRRRIPAGGFAARLNILYCPKGPLLDWSNQTLRKLVLDDLQSFAKTQGAIFLKVDPDIEIGSGFSSPSNIRPDDTNQDIQKELKSRGWKYSSDQIQFKNTIMVELGASEKELLDRMKQKTRYNVRLAEKKGVAIRTGALGDLPMLCRMYAETAVRDGFAIREEGYYRRVWEAFMTVPKPTNPAQQASTPWAEPLIAEVAGETAAAIFLFYFAKRAYYLYGMSREIHREKMPNYLLQWEAIKRAKANSCKVYDLWGAPDEFNETDNLWNVYRFKEGLGGRVVRTIGAWDFAPNAFWYRLYSQVIPHFLDLMRIRGKVQTRHALTER